MKTRFCLPIIAASLNECGEIAAKGALDYSHFEFWLDYLSDFSIEGLDSLVSAYGNRSVFLFRRENLESPKMQESIRLQALQMLAERGALVDLDLTSQSSELSYVRKVSMDSPLIVSYHNYSCTPDDRGIAQVLAAMRAHNPTVKKVACYCNSESDAGRLVVLMRQLRESKEKFIVLGMGEHGKITRLCGALWGNELNFAPISREASSAPGQFTINEFKQILGMLE